MSPLPLWAHELVVAPLAFGLSFLHARRALGAARAAGELCALVAYGYGLEVVAIRVFSSHAYSGAWALAPLGVPLAVALAWAAVISSAMALAARSGARRAGARAAAAALIAMSLDLVMEPVAVRAGLWRWTPPGPWLGVPVGNFVGWGVIVGVYAAGAERLAGDGAPHREAARRLGVAATSVLALVLVGLAWRRLHAELLFAGAGAWVAWGAILFAAGRVGRARGTAAEGDGLGARLGRAPGLLPVAVFLVLAASFAADAAACADPRLGIVALGSAMTLMRISGRASSGS